MQSSGGRARVKAYRRVGPWRIVGERFSSIRNMGELRPRPILWALLFYRGGGLCESLLFYGQQADSRSYPSKIVG